jgi:uncharacterized surface protein with fasciclin (FAS1) repeats
MNFDRRRPTTPSMPSFVIIEDAVVTTPDLPATNGVVHFIDRVLMPAK